MALPFHKLAVQNFAIKAQLFMGFDLVGIILGQFYAQHNY